MLSVWQHYKHQVNETNNVQILIESNVRKHSIMSCQTLQTQVQDCISVRTIIFQSLLHANNYGLNRGSRIFKKYNADLDVQNTVSLQEYTVIKVPSDL